MSIPNPNIERAKRLFPVAMLLMMTCAIALTGAVLGFVGVALYRFLSPPAPAATDDLRAALKVCHMYDGVRLSIELKDGQLGDAWCTTAVDTTFKATGDP